MGNGAGSGHNGAQREVAVRRIAAGFSVGCSLLVLFGCAGSKAQERGWLGNQAALASSVSAPAVGSPDARAYVAPGSEGAQFGTVRLLPVTSAATHGNGPEMEGLLKRIAATAREGAFRALTASERFEAVVPAEAPAALELKVEALTHLAAIGGRVTADPFTGDSRSKLFIVYTLSEVGTGKVVAKYTGIGVSQWEHTPRAMEDLEKQGVALGQEFFLFLLGI
jgi:hypothetical protein